MKTKIIQPPALEYDALMSREYGIKVSPNGKLERRIVANLFEHLKDRGFYVTRIYDGEEFSKSATTKDAMELIFNLDEASLRFRKEGFDEHGVLLVLGNGIDIIGDWSFFDDDRDGFDAAMQAFNPEDYA